MVELKIDKEFREKIPPLTDAEFEQLRENILTDGEVYEPIVTWNGTIVDGHNRWRIIQEHPGIPYKVKEMDFADKWAAFEWMYRKQLGRRNLTDEQKTYMMGKMYEARKKSVGAQEGHTGRNQHTVANVDKMSESATRREQRNGTAGEIGKEFGVDGRSVRRNEKFAQGVDALKEVSQEAADKILKGEAKTAKSAVAELKDATEEEVKQFAADVLANKPIKAKQPRPMSPQMKDFTKKLADVVAEMENTEKVYGLDDAIRDLNSAEDMFINQVEFVLDERKEVIAYDERGKEQVIAFIESAINDLNEMKGRFI